MALKEEANGQPWSLWDDELKLREEETLIRRVAITCRT